MFEKHQTTHAIGFEIDPLSLRGVALSYIRGKLKLDSSFDFSLKNPTDESANVKPLYINEIKQNLKSFPENYLIVTMMKSQETLIRPLELKLVKEKDIDAVLAFQAEPLLPYPPENALVDKIILSKNKEGSKLSIIAARKDHIAQHIIEWQTLEIEPEVVSTEPVALAAFAAQFTSTTHSFYALHIGMNQSLCILVDQHKLIAAQSISIGFESLIEAFAKDEKMTLSAAREQFVNSSFSFNLPKEGTALHAAVEAMRVAMTLMIYALAKQVKGREIDSILFVGPGAINKELIEMLSHSWKKEIIPLNIDPSFEMNLYDLQKFSLPIGAALTVLPKNRDQINFRQQEFTFAHPWKRLKKPIILYMILCMGVALALFIYGKAYISYQEDKIKHQYLELLNLMYKPYVDFEKEIGNKLSTRKQINPEEFIRIENLTPEEIKIRLNYLEKEIQSTPQLYPLQPNVPLVSDVLAWLSNLPAFVDKNQKDIKQHNALQIESLTYSMIKRPEPTKKQEKYQVKIELEFSSPTPKMAREFHDILITPNEFVDSKAEIKWNSNRDKYRTSFYLKDKTVYLTP